MAAKRRRAKCLCLILILLNLVLNLFPPLAGMLFPHGPEWLQFLSPVWTSVYAVLLASGTLVPMTLVLVSVEGVELVLAVMVLLLIALDTVLPLIGWLRASRGGGNGGRLIRIPMTAQMILTACAAVILIFNSIILASLWVSFLYALFYAAAASLLPILILRSMYAWL